MGMLIDGKWSTAGRVPDREGRFIRTETHFRDWITADGSSGFSAEAGRYHLYVSWACPWAHRTLILRTLLGLREAIGLSVVDAFMGEDGWHFSTNPGAIPDGVHGAAYLRDVYLRAKPGYTGRCSVPVLWDKTRGTIVNNESREIARMLDTAFGAGEGGAPYLPDRLAEEVDRVIDAIFGPINNGVYGCGFATTQTAYEEAARDLFAALDHWEGVLGRQRYLCGDVLTEADWCLFPTLVRFDPVYHTHFKCNLRRLVDYPNLWNYTRELYQVPGVAETCDFDHIKTHYFTSHESINPTRIVPIGPEVDFSTPHDRDRAYRKA